MHTYRSANAKLSYLDRGKGPPVIFLHPTPLDHFYWLPLLEELRGIRAILPDLRGHGASELGSNLTMGGFSLVPDAPVLTMAALAQDSLALLDSLGIESAIFAGCSIGGYVLLELWRQAPHRVSGLAFICSKPQPDAEANLKKRAAIIAQVRTGQSDALFDGMAQSLTGSTSRKNRPAIVSELRARMTLSPEALVATQAGLATRPDSLPTVATIRVPVFAIAGGEDTAIAVDDMHAFEAAPGGCTFHVLADAGHFAAYEHPRAVALQFSQWLQNLPR